MVIGVMTMEAGKKINNQELNTNNNLDVLCREFNGESFYGLEYIVEDFFQIDSNSTHLKQGSAFDWFGLFD